MCIQNAGLKGTLAPVVLNPVLALASPGSSSNILAAKTWSRANDFLGLGWDVGGQGQEPLSGSTAADWETENLGGCLFPQGPEVSWGGRTRLRAPDSVLACIPVCRGVRPIWIWPLCTLKPCVTLVPKPLPLTFHVTAYWWPGLCTNLCASNMVFE